MLQMKNHDMLINNMFILLSLFVLRQTVVEFIHLNEKSDVERASTICFNHNS